MSLNFKSVLSLLLFIAFKVQILGKFIKFKNYFLVKIKYKIIEFMKCVIFIAKS